MQEEVIISKDKNPINLDIKNIAKSPINVEFLKKELSYYQHPDKYILLKGFTEGFSLNYSGPHFYTEAKNLKSVNQQPQVVKQKINKEVSLRRVAGPFQNRPIYSLRVSPIGIVPKKEPGEYRLIHHLSHPSGQSLNDFIDQKLCTVRYTQFDEAVHMLQDLGKNCKIWKVDIKSAFRLLPVHPKDFDQLGYKFDSNYYIDKCMPFGCSISCSTFEKFACFLEFCMKRRMSSGKLLHYLDDYLGGDKSYDASRMLMQNFVKLLMEMNVPMADEKTVGPVSVLCFLGLELDSDEMVVRMPTDKIKEIIARIKLALTKEKVTLRFMQSLIGQLSFASRVIYPGRPFCRRLINATCGLTKPFHHLRVNKAIKADLRMWLTFFENYNGISVFHDRFWVSNQDVQLYSDAAASLGFGSYFNGQWCYALWPPEWRSSGLTSDITILELFPIIVALHIWGAKLRNKKIVFFCDNQAVVHILNTMTSKSERVMILVREATMCCLKFNIAIKANYLEGKRNLICDSLSRMQIDRFRELAPEAEAQPQTIPSQLWTIFETGCQTF